MSNREEQFARGLKQHLDRSAGELRPGLAYRLQSAPAEALARLAERYPLIALSNGTANVFRTAAGPYFRDAVSAREVGVSKPDPRIFAVALERTGLRPEQVLHVGDDPGHDVQGARAVGMPVAWYQPHERAWPHDDAPPLRLTHLRELCDRLLA